MLLLFWINLKDLQLKRVTLLFSAVFKISVPEKTNFFQDDWY